MSGLIYLYSSLHSTISEYLLCTMITIGESGIHTIDIFKDACVIINMKNFANEAT